MKERALKLTGGGDKGTRRAKDFYPTPADVTRALCVFLSGLGYGSMKVWEPACGDGAMARELAAAGHTVEASDVRETGFGRGGVDFLKERRPGFDAIITNPPFFLAEQFIIKASREAPIAAMLLKSQYWHAASRLSTFQMRRPAYVLPLTWRPDFCFGERGGAPTMEVLWTLWIWGEDAARYQPLPRPVELKGAA